MSKSDRLVEVHFPITASLIAVILVGILCWIYWLTTSDWSKVAIFLAASSAAAGAVLSAFYAARALDQTVAALERQEVDHRKAMAFQFTGKWNDPAMYYVRDAIRELFAGDHNSAAFKELLKAKETNVIHFLNFLEEVAIAIENDVADAQILKNAFAGVVVTAWTKLGAWTIEERRNCGRPLIWIKVEELARQWAQ